LLRCEIASFGATCGVLGLIVGSASLVPALPLCRWAASSAAWGGVALCGGASLSAVVALAFVVVGDYWMLLVLQLAVG